MNIGTVIKKVRTEKNLTQTYVCKGICSRTFLSKIENSHSYPSIDIFLKILNRLDLTVDEFIYRTNSSDLFKKDYICNYFFGLRDNSDIDSLVKVRQLCDEYLLIDEHKLIQDILLTVNHLINLKNKKEIIPNDESLNNVWNRLQTMDYFGIYEIKLLNSMLFLFPLDVAINISVIILKSVEKEGMFTENIQFKMILYLNISTLYFFNRKFVESNMYAKIANKLSEEAHRYDIAHFTKVRIAIIEKNTLIERESTEILRMLGLENLIEELTMEYSFINIKKSRVRKKN